MQIIHAYALMTFAKQRWETGGCHVWKPHRRLSFCVYDTFDMIHFPTRQYLCLRHRKRFGEATKYGIYKKLSVLIFDLTDYGAMIPRLAFCWMTATLWIGWRVRIKQLRGYDISYWDKCPCTYFRAYWAREECPYYKNASVFTFIISISNLKWIWYNDY